MGERLTIIIAFLAVLLSIIAVISGIGIKPVDVDVNSVGENEIIDGSVTTDEISDNSILPEDLNPLVADYIVEQFHISDDSVSSKNIIDKSITGDDLMDNSVSSKTLVDNSINTSDIADGSITNEKLASNALQWNDINGIPVKIFAAGYIKEDATVEYDFNVNSVEYDSSSKYYEINATGYDFNNNYITVVTPYGFGITTQVAHSFHGPTIWFANSTNYVQTDFYFVTYILNWMRNHAENI